MYSFKRLLSGSCLLAHYSSRICSLPFCSSLLEKVGPLNVYFIKAERLFLDLTKSFDITQLTFRLPLLSRYLVWMSSKAHFEPGLGNISFYSFIQEDIYIFIIYYRLQHVITVSSAYLNDFLIYLKPYLFVSMSFLSIGL